MVSRTIEFLLELCKQQVEGADKLLLIFNRYHPQMADNPAGKFKSLQYATGTAWQISQQNGLPLGLYGEHILPQSKLVTGVLKPS